VTAGAPVLITGVAGFIGHATAQRLLARGDRVIGIDNLNAHYDPALKAARLATLDGHAAFQFVKTDITEPEDIARLVRDHAVRRVIHLAAHAGVRRSTAAPLPCERTNVAGHLAVLEACRQTPGFEHLLYASSSSVYGDRPLGAAGFREDDPADTPVSVYAATKRAAELISQSYAALHGLPQTGLRFFTVYGPWGRPDMAYFRFTRQIIAGEPLNIYGGGEMARDFTYIDDIVDGIVGALDRAPAAGEHRIFNIGEGRPEGLMTMIATLEAALGRTARTVMQPMQPGDVTTTRADITRLHRLTGYSPQVRLAEGLQRFVDWYRDFYGVAA